MPKAQTGMAGGKYRPNTYDVNLVKRHDDNSAINIYGSYGNTYLAIPHGGHNTLFKDAQGSHGATGSALRRKNRDWTPGSGVTTKWVIALGH